MKTLILCLAVGAAASATACGSSGDARDAPPTAGASGTSGAATGGESSGGTGAELTGGSGGGDTGATGGETTGGSGGDTGATGGGVSGGSGGAATGGSGGGTGGGMTGGTGASSTGGASGGNAGAAAGGSGGGDTGATGGVATGGSGGSDSGGTAGEGTGAAGGGETGGAAGSTSSSGCGQAPPSQVPTQVDVDGATGTFLLSVPATYGPNTPTPIVFAFHGAGTSGEMFSSQYYGNLLSTLADDFIVVHPDALDGNAWDTTADVPFFDAMLTLLSATYCVDEARVFATGHSSGGFFSNTLGCERGDVLRAIAPVSGGGPFVFGAATCNGQVAAWIAHATNDDTVDFSSGEGSRDHWVEANGCDINQTTDLSPSYPCVEYGGCSAGYPVRWCVYEDGHNWPDFAPQGIYDFFSSF